MPTSRYGLAKEQVFRRPSVGVWQLFSLLFFVAVWLGEQTNFVVLRGVVEDPQHLAIAHASVKLKAVETGAERSVTANRQGTYEIGGLLAGAYLPES